MSKALEYLENYQKLTSRLIAEQLGNIEKAAQTVANVYENGGNLFSFGTGHSHMLAEEIFYRAGGFVNVRPILESSLMLHESASVSTELERIGELGNILFEAYGLKSGDVLFVFSNSGRNGTAIDLAKTASENGVRVIAVTSMEHTLSGKSRHPSGKKLYEFAETVIDNCGCTGDASISIDGLDCKVSPTSTSAGSCIMNAVMARTAEIMVSHGFVPEIFSSSNVDGGDEINRRYVEKYRNIIKSL